MSDGYSLKEMLQEVRNDNKQALVAQATILKTLENIDEHLKKLNSKVASHEKRFTGLESFQSKVMTAWAFGTFIFVTAVNKLF